MLQRHLKYFLNGFRNALIFGVPNFEENNQSRDMKNIASDFNYSIKVLSEQKKAQISSKEPKPPAK